MNKRIRMHLIAIVCLTALFRLPVRRISTQHCPHQGPYPPRSGFKGRHATDSAGRDGRCSEGRKRSGDGGTPIQALEREHRLSPDFAERRG